MSIDSQKGQERNGRRVPPPIAMAPGMPAVSIQVKNDAPCWSAVPYHAPGKRIDDSRKTPGVLLDPWTGGAPCKTGSRTLKYNARPPGQHPRYFPLNKITGLDSEEYYGPSIRFFLEKNCPSHTFFTDLTLEYVGKMAILLSVLKVGPSPSAFPAAVYNGAPGWRRLRKRRQDGKYP